MRRFFTYWAKCAQIAWAGSAEFANDWQWLFGVPVVSGVAGYIAAQRGETTLSTGYPIIDGILTALGAFIITWLVAFLVRLVRAPVMLDDASQTEIERLKTMAGEARSTSFDVESEVIHEHDPDRMIFGEKVENLFRVAITNIQVDKPVEAYVVLEDLSPELGVSPAAHLPVMGKEKDTPTFHIAASETAYVLLLKRYMERSFFSERDQEFSPWVSFSVSVARSWTS